MKIRVCIIGNSHLAAVKLGWNDVETKDAFEPTFFGARGGQLQELEVEGTDLVPRSEKVNRFLEFTSGGKTRICTADYDAFVLVGLKTGMHHAMATYKNHRLARHAEFPLHYPVSEACLKAAVSGGLMQSVAVQLIRQLRSITAAPIVVVPDPFPRSGVLHSDMDYWAIEEARTLIFSLYQKFLDKMECKMGVILVRQPEVTIIDRMFTADSYAQGSVRLSADMEAQHEQDELLHANPKYGSRVLRDVLATLSQGVATQP